MTVTNSGGSVTSSPAALTVSGTGGLGPTITTQPLSQAVTVGATVSFTVVASGTAPLSYQWSKNSSGISGATSATLTLGNVQTSAAGSYSVVVTNSAGSVTGSAAQLTVNPAAAAPTISTQPNNQTVLAGASVSFSLSATGTPPLTYQWRRDGMAVAGATNATLTVASVQPSDAGSYTVVVSNAAGSVTSQAVSLTVAYSSRISNMSVRTNLASGQTLIVGFVTSGAKNMLLRAVGPSLKTVFGLTTFYADPRLALINQGTGAIVASNDNWPASLSATCASVGAFPMDPGSKDAGLAFPVNGPHTAQINGTGSGIVTVEVYDAESENAARLTNVSARNQVGTGDNILIAGFVIDGTTPTTLLIRGIGPALRDVFGVSGFLADPKLEIYRQDNTWVGENDNWSASLVSTFDQVGAYRFTSGSKDAALLITLPPGVYTAQLSGVGNTTGDGVVEVYEVP